MKARAVQGESPQNVGPPVLSLSRGGPRGTYWRKEGKVGVPGWESQDGARSWRFGETGVTWVQETWNLELAMQMGCRVFCLFQTSSSSTSTAPVSRASTGVLVPGTAESLGALRLQLV